jgi:hypothetical protein
LDARDCGLAFGPDFSTVPTSGNTRRQQAKTLAVLKEPWLHKQENMGKLSGLSLGISRVEDIPKE